MQLINHPNVIKIKESFFYNEFNQLAIVMELGDYDLASRFKQDQLKLDKKEKLNVAVGIARAVHYLHRHGITHRDVKPENIMFGSEWKLSDFGASKNKTDMLSSQQGTLYYMAPEMLKKK